MVGKTSEAPVTLADINRPCGHKMALAKPEEAVEARWPGLAAIVARGWSTAWSGGYSAELAAQTPWEVAADMMAYDADLEQFFVDPEASVGDQLAARDDALRLAIANYIAGYSEINHG